MRLKRPETSQTLGSTVLQLDRRRSHLLGSNNVDEMLLDAMISDVGGLINFLLCLSLQS